jgi:hypothetical protein
MRYSNHIILSYSLSSRTLWKPSGLVLSLVAGFFGESSTWVEVCLYFNKFSFKCHVNTSPLMFDGKHLVISSYYHTYISFILNRLPYNTTYPSWLVTSYNCPFFMMLMWSYHWRRKCPFLTMPLQVWTYNNPQLISGYYHSYCFGKWSTCLEGGLPLFPSSHLMTSGYPYHQSQFLKFNGHHHCWPNLHKYGATSIDENNTCSDDDCSKEDTIIAK